MDENRKDIMEYYDEWYREPPSDIKWYRKIIPKKWFKKIGKGNLISFIFLVLLVSVTCYFYKLESNAYTTLSGEIYSWKSDLTFASMKLESNNYAFGSNKEPVILKNTTPLYIQINDEKILVQKDSLEIHTQLFHSDRPMRMDTPWPIAKGEISVLPVRNPTGVFGDNKGYLVDVTFDSILEGVKKKPNKMMLGYSGDSAIKLKLYKLNNEDRFDSKVYINGENQNIKGDEVILTPCENNDRKKSINFVVSNFISFGVSHHTGREGSEISNFEIESYNTFLSADTSQGAVLNIIKSATPQKIDVPKTKVLGKGDMYFTLKFDGKSFGTDVTGMVTDMTIADKSIFPNIWQWARDNAITILTTILTAAITAFLGRESLYSKKK